jgi:serine/threonine protein kinase
LRAKAVPNVDRLAISYSDDHHGAVAFLEPKGISVMPKTIQQVLEAVGCILDTLIVSLLSAHILTSWSYLLQVMHAEPRPIFHRDIRWPNVVQCADDPRKWFLIDWEDAATVPTLSAKHLDKRCHSPAVFKDNHGPEVDLWSVGMLIIESSGCFPSFPLNLLNSGKAMQSGGLNVSQSIQRILALKAEPKEDTMSIA